MAIARTPDMTAPLFADQQPQATPAAASTKLPDNNLQMYCAYLLSAPMPRRLNLDEVLRWEPKQGPLWIHLDHGQIIPEVLKERYAIDGAVLQSLLAEARWIQSGPCLGSQRNT